jgi:multiple antibiotic resistance protein
MSLAEYIVLAIGSLFVIIDPLALVPLFLAMTPRDTPAQRIRTAGMACAVAAGVLIAFALIGQWIFKFLGITLPAFQMAGSVVLFMIALDMLRARRSPVQETTAETDEGLARTDIAIAPLGIPMLAGPGAISTIILLQGKAAGLHQQSALLVCIVVVCAASYLILRLSAQGAKWLSPLALRLATRLMGLLLTAIAFQFFLNAMVALKIIPAGEAARCFPVVNPPRIIIS